MNKLLSLLISAVLLVSCAGDSAYDDKARNNSTTGADTSQRGDTSSYERMPHKTTDTTQH